MPGVCAVLMSSSVDLTTRTPSNFHLPREEPLIDGIMPSLTMSEKAKALLKQGRQAFYAKDFDAAEKAFREAKDLAAAGKHRRLYARALGRLQNVLGFRSRINEVWEEVRGATMDRNEDERSGLMLWSLFFLTMSP